MISPDKTYVICSLDDPSPVAYMNLFEPGDVWEKIQGCSPCQVKDRCCRGCRIFVEDLGCAIHLSRDTLHKPFVCVTRPVPNQGMDGCTLTYLCVRGSKKGKLRHVGKGLDELEKD